MPGPPRFRTQTHDGMLTIRFDHPPTRNALDRETRTALVERLQRADDDPTIRVIIVTGTDPAFTSGVDAKQLLGDTSYERLPVDPATQLRAIDTPSIAAVNGACVSGGLEIALGCSMIIASDQARFADTHTRIGITPGWGLSAELPAAIGVGRARQMSLTGLPIDAQTALSWGLVNEVVTHDRLEARAHEIAGAIRAIDARSIRNAISLYRRGQEAVLGAVRAEERAVAGTWNVDHVAAHTAFAQSVSPPST